MLCYTHALTDTFICIYCTQRFSFYCFIGVITGAALNFDTFTSRLPWNTWSRVAACMFAELTDNPPRPTSTCDSFGCLPKLTLLCNTTEKREGKKQRGGKKQKTQMCTYMSIHSWKRTGKVLWKWTPLDLRTWAHKEPVHYRQLQCAKEGKP